MPMEITLPATIEFDAEAESVVVKRINFKPDDSGDWTIGAQLVVTSPEREEVEGLSLSEHHTSGAQITVTRAEIATVTGQTEEAVQSMPVDTLKEAVTTIAMGKLLTAFVASS